MSEIQLVMAQAFATGTEAQLAKGLLESAGINAMMQADTVGGTRPHVAWSSGGFKIFVREEDLVDARLVLTPFENPQEPEI